MKLFFALVALAACEHKGPDQAAPAPAPAPAQPAPPAAKPSDDMKPEPVAKAPPAPPAPAPTDDVRPPVASDLADYVKDMKGTGPLMATVETSMGTIHCQLFDDKAPIGVANFVGLATGKKPWLDPKSHEVQKGKPYYDGLTFHRVIAGFMVQTGDPLGVGTGGPGYKFDNEIDRSLKMDPGAMAYANTGQNGTNGSQFFIMEGSKPGLLGGYTIFGQCKEVDVVAKITHVPTSGPPKDMPNSPITLKKVTISRGK